MLRLRRCATVATGITVALALTRPILVRTQQPQILNKSERRVSGQNIQPVFEGWEHNKDGTFSLYFGYLNRNYEEIVDVAIGPDNQIDPGVDRGQPTHFLPRRQTNVFFVGVPNDFGTNKQVVWTVKAHGVVDRIAGSLDPLYEINATYDTTTGNTPPVVKVDKVLKASLVKPLTLELSAVDDGLPTRGKLSVVWNKYRGPGLVMFAPPAQDLKEETPVAVNGGRSGKATTLARFSEAGEYDLDAIVSDGQYGRSCCRTHAFVHVTVSPN